MNTDGKNLLQLTDHGARDMSPVWSPNGQWIAFNSNRDGNCEVYVMDADGRNVHRLTNDPADDTAYDWFDLRLQHTPSLPQAS